MRLLTFKIIIYKKQIRGLKMKKTKLGVLFVVMLLVISVASASMLIPRSEKANPNDKASLTPPGLEKIEFIHYKKEFAKPEAAKAPKPPTCYKFLTPTKVRWTTLPVNYVINPTNPQNLDASFVTSAVFNSAETWDASTSKELMNNAYKTSTGTETTYGVQNYVNAISFGNYPTTGVIAVTIVWYNQATKAIVEFDILFDTDFTWGDADINPSLMDLQNIATHELGHGVGLGDLYNTACVEETMYGYSIEGETKKRDLNRGDIVGLLQLYG